MKRMKMKIDRIKAQFLLKLTVTILAIVTVFGYTIFVGKKFIFRSTITVSNPQNGEIVYSPLLEIIGNGKNMRKLTISDYEINITQDGDFNHKILVFPGYNKIKLEGIDHFNKEHNKIIEIYYSDNL